MSVSESYLATMERLSWEQGESVGRRIGITQERERFRKLIEQEYVKSDGSAHYYRHRLLAALAGDGEGK